MNWNQIDFSGPKGEPKITLRKNMQIGMNTSFVKKYQIEKYSGVSVFVSDDKTKIGFKFTVDCNSSTQTAIIKRTNNCYFTVKELKNFYDIDAKKSEFTNLNHDQDNDMFIVDIMQRKG